MSNDRWDSADIDQAVVDLRAAGWTPKGTSFWKSPSGALYLGPAGAWKVMQRAKNDDPTYNRRPAQASQAHPVEDSAWTERTNAATLLERLQREAHERAVGMRPTVSGRVRSDWHFTAAGECQPFSECAHPDCVLVRTHLVAVSACCSPASAAQSDGNAQTSESSKVTARVAPQGHPERPDWLKPPKDLIMHPQYGFTSDRAEPTDDSYFNPDIPNSRCDSRLWLLICERMRALQATLTTLQGERDHIKATLERAGQDAINIAITRAEAAESQLQALRAGIEGLLTVLRASGETARRLRALLAAQTAVSARTPAGPERPEPS